MSKRINFFDDRSKARNKIGVWLGSNTHQAVIHTIKELTSNSGDILMEGFGDKIIWTIYDNKTVEIYDNAIGLPIEGKTTIEKKDARGNEIQEEKTNYELLLLTLFAGTKHNGLETGETNTGTNGIFNTVLTYTSAYVEYEIGRPDGNIYFCSFKEGFIDKELQIIGKTDKTYTRIKYSLSDQVYTDNYFTFEELCDICQKQSALIQKPIQIIDKVNNQEKYYYLSNGLEELLDVFTNKEENICENIIIKDSFSKNVKFNNKDYTDNMKYKMILGYSRNEDTVTMDFLNRSELIHHGTIYDGIIDGLRKTIHAFISKEGMYNKKESNINKDDVLCGLNFIIDFKSLHPNMYSNQTKFETQIKYFKPLITQSIINFFEVYSIENKDEMIKIANKVLINKRSREQSEISRNKIKKELSEKITSCINRPKKFVPCRSKNPKDIELIIIEGDSAMNSVKLSRDSNTMCIYPLKGKPINAMKNKLNSVINNQEIKDIFKILGCGMVYKEKSIKGFPKFNIDNLNLDNILISTDFDEDGFHIQSLLIGLFYVLAPELIKQCKLNILYSPLYVIKTKKEEVFAYSEIQKNQIIKDLKEKHISYKETRYKGLGGLPVKIMAKAMSKEHRFIKKITMNDVEESIKYIELFLSEEKLKERKEYIEAFGDKYFDYSIFE